MTLLDSVPGQFVPPIDYWVTLRLAADTKPVGFPHGVAVHYSTGGGVVALPFGRPRDSNLVVEIT